MKRIHTAYYGPGEGAVYRELLGCSGSSSSGCGECLDTEAVGVITQPGCSAWPVVDNNYGALPTAFAGDVEIDTYGYESRFMDLVDPYAPPPGTECPDPPEMSSYPNLWKLVQDVSPDLADKVLSRNCYCTGAGIDQPTLSIGRPQFPHVSTLPFFSFPGYRSTSIRVRKYNPDGPPLPGTCCPQSDDEQEHILAEFVGDELRLTRREKPVPEQQYRADDTHHSFQLVGGYPRWCCLKNDCASATSGGPDDYVERYLHFPQWPGPNSVTPKPRDPYDPVNPQEPLSVIPVVVDIGCHDDGKLYVYFAQLIVHDGHIAGVKWDTERPRSSAEPTNYAPRPPEDLPLNQDWQGLSLFPDSSLTPISRDKCKQNCNEAAKAMDKEAEACAPTCYAPEYMCPGQTQQIATGLGVDEMDASLNAALAAEALAASLSCTPESYQFCYVFYSEPDAAYKAAFAFCCPNP